jgi:membrane protein YdbS with pleckstrin-like domain
MNEEHTLPPSSDVVADGEFHELDARHIAHSRLVGGITTIAVASGLLVGMIIVFVAIDSMPAVLRVLIPIAVLLLVIGMGVLAWRWPALEHRYARYRVDDDGLEIRRGVWWRSSIRVPKSRVQHTDVSQGPLERNFELSTLHVFTAGTEHSEVTLAGLERSRAHRIRDHLLSGGEHDGV